MRARCGRLCDLLHGEPGLGELRVAEKWKGDRGENRDHHDDATCGQPDSPDWPRVRAIFDI